MLVYEDIVEICASYTGQNYFVLDLIPARKLANARAYYPLPDEEAVVALIDTTAFGSAKTGVAICRSGIYWRNQTDRKYSYIAWENVAPASIRPKGIVNPRIEMEPDVTIELVAGGISKDQVFNLFSEISSLQSYSPTVANKGWMLATRGQQRGPYNRYDLQFMASLGTYDPSTSFVWREGMENWVPMTQVPELQTVFEVAHTSERSEPPPPPNFPDTVNNLANASEKEPPTNVAQRTLQQGYKSLIDVNNADVEEMIALPVMDLNNAERVVAARKQRGGFKEIEEVGQLLELKPHEVERLKKKALVGPRPQGASSGRVVDF